MVCISSLQSVQYSGIFLREDLGLLDQQSTQDRIHGDNPMALLSLINSIRRSITVPPIKKKRKRDQENATPVSNSPHKQQSRISPSSRVVRLMLEDIIHVPVATRVFVATRKNGSALWKSMKRDVGDPSKVRTSYRPQNKSAFFESTAQIESKVHFPSDLQPDSFSFYKEDDDHDNTVPHFVLKLCGAKEVVVTLRQLINLEVELWADVDQCYGMRHFSDALSEKSFRLCTRAGVRFYEEVSGCFLQCSELLATLQARLRTIENWKANISGTDTPGGSRPLQNVDYNVVSPTDSTESSIVTEIEIVTPDILEELDRPWEQAIRRFYGAWINGGHELLFSEAEQDGLLVQFETWLPQHAAYAYSTVLKSSLAHQSSVIRARKIQALCSFLANCRVKNKYAVKHFAIANTLCFAAKGRQDVALRVQVRKGNAMSYTAAFKTLDEIAKECTKRIPSLLQRETVFLASVDNFQEFTLQKFQRNASSVTAKHGTTEYLARAKHTAPPPGSTLLIRRPNRQAETVVVDEIIWEGPYQSILTILHTELVEVIIYPDKDVTVVEVSGAQPRPELVYIDQKSPIPLGFRDFPLFDLDHSTANNDDGEASDNEIDNENYNDHDDDDNLPVHEMDYVDETCVPRELFVQADSDVNDEVEVSVHNDPRENEMNPDFTVEDYITKHEVSMIVGELFRYTGRSFQCETNSSEEQIKDSLQRNRHLVQAAKSYQQRMIQCYNPYVGDITQLLMLPMSTYDEISKVGCSSVIFELLERIGLISSDEEGSIDPLRTGEKVHLHLTVDYLTAKNVRCIETDLIKQLTHPGSESYVLGCLDSLKPLRVHQAPFHTMMHMVDAIQRVFYPGLIQVVQGVLGWKRIRYDSMTRFQLTAALHDIMYEELTRVYVEDWAASLAKRGALTVGENKSLVTLSDLAKSNQEDILVALAKDYLAFMKKFHRGETNDERANCLGQFHFWTMLRRRYHKAIREGDPFVMEYLHTKWLEMFVVSKKSNYVESTLCCAETLVALSPLDLEDFRKNVCIRLHDDRDSVAFDEFIEMLNDDMKTFQNSKSIQAVSTKSQHLFAGLAACRTLEPSANRRKSSTKPQRLRERQATYNLCRDLEPTILKGDKLDSNGFWPFFPKHKLSHEPKVDSTVGQEEKLSLVRLQALFSKLSKKTATVVPDANDEEESGDDQSSEAGEDNEESAEDSIKNMKKYALKSECGRSIRAKALSLLGDVRGKRSEARKRQQEEKELTEAIVREWAEHDQSYGTDKFTEALESSNMGSLENWETVWKAS